jgi:hypothetical protein
MKTTKQRVPIAVARAQTLAWQLRLKEAAEKRAAEARAAVYRLCKKLARMKSLEAMQNYVDNFLDSRADNICNELLEATTLEKAREILEKYKKPKPIIFVEHCHNYEGRHVFRIREPEMIPGPDIVHSQYLSGLAELERRMCHKKETLLGGKYRMRECEPWAPHDEAPAAMLQSQQRKRQRAEEGSWSLHHGASQTHH